MSARARELLFHMDTASLLPGLAPDVARRLEAYADVTARTAHDLLVGMESIPGASDKDKNIYLRRTTAQIVQHFGGLGLTLKRDWQDRYLVEVDTPEGPALERAYPDGLRIASYTDHRRGLAR